MNKIIRLAGKIALLLALAIPSVAVAQDNDAADYFISSPVLTRNGNLMTVGIDFDFNDLRLDHNQAAVFTPLITNGSDTLSLTPVGVYGRTAYYQLERGILHTLPIADQIVLRYNKKGENFGYTRNVDYADWMNGSELLVRMQFYGCASCNIGKALSDQLAVYYVPEMIEFQPQLIYQAAIVDEVKTRELSGRAYVDFPVNKIVIYPEYRNNVYELGKIIATIDSVKNDPDITVTSIHIAGTASPEGPYENNVYLAKNRTISLKDYVTNLYNFPQDFIQTDFEPVDWKGLREWLEGNNLNHKEEILAIVNSDIEPYARNSKIKKDFPTEYEWLLRNVYPALRHSDYLIQYQIRGYTDIAEIAEIIRTKPQKLSLGEMYRLAASLPVGSDQYNEVFDIAVRLYPDDETANLNAANSALARKDFVYAERYLQKAGNSPEADYARGILKAMQGDFNEAMTLLQKAVNAGVPGSRECLDKVMRLKTSE
ncbi:MAG: hypothetical protein J1F67_11320 [Muribaculaceae bacterium]|nr:hypothetical protein [Muribaculaceae bacterium]